MRGGLIVSFALLCVILPRALLFSPYLHPLLRSIVFFVPAVLLSLLIAALLDQIQHAERARLQLTAVHQQLSQSFKRLEENQEQLLQAEKLTSLGQMAASIAHELNNSLAGVLIYTQLLAKKTASDTLSKEVALDYLSKMDSEIDRSSRTIHNLLDFARPSAPKLTTVDVNQVIEKALSLVGHQAKLERTQVIKELDPSLPVLWADFDQLRQVFVNLILNAIQATENGGTLMLSTFPTNERGVRVKIEDTGSGISPENLRKLFTPFFTTKEKGQGVGLGLTVAHEIIERHGGRIEVESKEGKGTTFTVSLPGREGEAGQSTSLQQ
jgi:signal transduction histidine kinase